MALYLTDDDLDDIDAWTLVLIADCRTDLSMAQDARRSIARAVMAAAKDDLGLIPFIRADMQKRMK